MTQQQIIAIGSWLALPLPAEVLKVLGIQAGDAVNVSLVGHQMVVEPVARVDRQERQIGFNANWDFRSLFEHWRIDRRRIAFCFTWNL